MSNKSSHLLDALMRGRPQPTPRGSTPRPASPRTAEFELPADPAPARADEPEEQPEEFAVAAPEAPAPEPESAPRRIERIRVPPSPDPLDEMETEEDEFGEELVPARRRSFARAYDAPPAELPGDMDPSLLGARERDRSERSPAGRFRGQFTLSHQEALLLALLFLVLLIGAFVLGRRTAPVSPTDVTQPRTASMDLGGATITPGSQVAYSLVVIEYRAAAKASADTLAGDLMREYEVQSWVGPSPKGGGQLAVFLGRFPAPDDPALEDLRKRLQNHRIDGKRYFVNSTYPTRLQD